MPQKGDAAVVYVETKNYFPTFILAWRKFRLRQSYWNKDLTLYSHLTLELSIYYNLPCAVLSVSTHMIQRYARLITLMAGKMRCTISLQGTNFFISIVYIQWNKRTITLFLVTLWFDLLLIVIFVFLYNS